MPFEPPYCGDVWNPAAPPAVASATVIGTVAYLDSTGYFSDQAGVAVLGGTTPWEIYLQVAIASSFGALDGSSTAAQTQCLAIFEIALGGTNAFSPVIVAESGKGICDHRYTQCIPLRSRALVILVICPPSLFAPARRARLHSQRAAGISFNGRPGVLQSPPAPSAGR